MKNALIIFMALATFAMNAQDRNLERREHRKEMKAKLSPEQRADLKSKKMTLALDLNSSQQKKVKQLFLERSNDRPEMSKNRNEMTDTQIYEAKSAMLDRRIAYKKQMKEILTDEQMAKWQAQKSERYNKRGRMMRKQVREH